MANKKFIFPLFFVLIVSAASAQKTAYAFSPKWKIGDKRTISIVQKEKELKKEKWTEEEPNIVAAEITVTKEDNENYFLKVLYENVAMTSAIKFYDRLGEELADYKNLDLQYKVNKQTGKPELLNWQEAQQFVNKSFEQIDSLLQKKVPDDAEFAGYAFAPIKKIFESQENIESYMTDNIGYIFFPYNKQYIVGDTMRIVERCENPLSPGDTTTQTTISYLSKIDDANKRCTIYSSAILDLTEFKKMMITMMQTMTSAFGAEDSVKTKATKEINELDFDVTNSTTIDYDYGTSWPIEIVKLVRVTGSDPSGKRETTVSSTVTIK
ncbi:MAG: hypothetical protein V4556_00360 [Bacteroidota bacterium]